MAMKETDVPDDVVDPIDVGKALDMLARMKSDDKEPAPYACCPRDGEPLVSTLEFRGAEFYCVVCRGKFGFLAPTDKPETPALVARHEELQAIYDAERAERKAAR